MSKLNSYNKLTYYYKNFEIQSGSMASGGYFLTVLDLKKEDEILFDNFWLAQPRMCLKDVLSQLSSLGIPCPEEILSRLQQYGMQRLENVFEEFELTICEDNQMVKRIWEWKPNKQCQNS